jgi:hypothetical protein
MTWTRQNLSQQVKGSRGRAIEKGLFTVRGEMGPWSERHAAVRTALLKRITDL